VNWRDLATSLGILAKGSQADKFRTLFGIFDKTGGGHLTLAQGHNMILTLTTSALAMNRGMSMLPSQYVYSLIDETSEAIFSSLLAFLKDTSNSKMSSSRLSESVFFEWYESLGRLFMPWVEILSKPLVVNQLLGIQTGSLKPGEEAKTATFQKAAKETIVKSSGAKDRQNLDPVFRFTLDNDVEISVTKANITLLHTFIATTKLSSYSCSSLYETFAKATQLDQSDHFLSRTQFEERIHVFVPHGLSAQQQQMVFRYLRTIFLAFDWKKQDQVPLNEFLSGLCLFVAGDKSEKLSHSWALFQNDGDGDMVLSSPALRSLLSGILTVLFVISSPGIPLNTAPSPVVIDATIERCVQNIFEFLGKRLSNNISFDEFGEFYNSGGGGESLAWLELLDIKKWHASSEAVKTTPSLCLSEPDFGSCALGFESSCDDDKDEEEANDLHDDELVFRARLSSNEDHVLEISTTDVAHIAELLALSDISSIDAEEIQSALIKASSEDPLICSQSCFRNALQEVLAFEDTDEEWVLFEEIMVNFFLLFDRDDSDRVLTASVASAISLLTSGNKSDKLALAFGLFDNDHDGVLSVHEFESFLASLLLGLFGLTEHAMSMLHEEIWETVDAATRTAVEDVLAFTDKNGKEGGGVSFESFAAFYASHGYLSMSFLELYDLSKWPLESVGLEDDSALIGAERIRPCSSPMESPVHTLQQQVKQDSSLQTNTNLPSVTRDVVLSFTLGNALHLSLDITERDIVCVQELSNLSGLGSVSPTDLREKFLQYTNKASTEVSVKSYEQFLTEALHHIDTPVEDQLQLISQFRTIFEVYKEASSKPVDPKKLLSGLYILTDGRKSDKLMEAFDGFDTAERGMLNKGQMHQFILAFLLGLCAIKRCSDPNACLSIEALSEYVVGITTSAFQDTTDIRESSDAMSFEEFAAWYSGSQPKHVGGYTVVPWLELLDLQKWMLALTQQQRYKTQQQQHEVAR